MKNKRILAEFFKHRSSDAPVLIALLAGMAAGAALGILFAPEGGRKLRSRICDWVDRGHDETEQEQTEFIHHSAVNQKKPKSDIRSLIHQAHVGAHTEQGIG